jgi:thiamine biosynthesis lipoprotein
VNCAGNLVIRGARGTAPWRVGLRNTRPKGPSDVLGYVLEDRAEAIATRGEDDPEARLTGVRSVTVVAPDAPAAAQAANALYAAGADWPALAQKLGVKEAVAVDAAGQISVTEPLAGRVKFLHDPPLKTLP